MGKTTNVTVPLRTRGERLKVQYNPDGLSRNRHIVVEITHTDRRGKLLGRLALTTHSCDALRVALNGIEAAADGLCVSTRP